MVMAGCLTTAQAQTEFRDLSYKAALAAAKTEGKMVFIDFMADWCGPCKIMEARDYPRQDVGEYMNAHFVNIKVNGEKGEGPSLVEKFQVTGYPTMFVVNTDGNIVMAIHGYTDGRELIRLIDNKIDPDKSLSHLKEKYAKGERDGKFVSLLCETLTKSEDVKDPKEVATNKQEAHRIAQEWWSSLPDSLKLKQDNQWVIFQYSPYPEDAAVQYLKANMDKVPDMYLPGFKHVVDKAYTDAIMLYLDGEKPYDKAAYEQYKKEFGEMQLFQQVQNSDVAFGFIDEWGKGNLDEYIDYCGANFGKLNRDQIHKVLMNYDNFLVDATDAQKKHAETMLRNALPDLDTQSMYYVTTLVKKLHGTY